MNESSLALIAHASRITLSIVDRFLDQRAAQPIVVSQTLHEILKRYHFESLIHYGHAAWIEIREDEQPIWTGAWGENLWFWLETAHGETVDLAAAHSFKLPDGSGHHSLRSVPLLWAKEIPSFYRYHSHGWAETDLEEPATKNLWQPILRAIEDLELPTLGTEAQPSDFPNEPIVCSGRRILDNSAADFRHFDRALSIFGMPEAPNFSTAQSP